MKDKKRYWLWYWGFSQDDTTLHSPKKKFYDFDKMKEYSAKHSADHTWVGSGYWSNYDNSEYVKESFKAIGTYQEFISDVKYIIKKKALARMPKCLEQDWVEIHGNEYTRIESETEILHPFERGSSTHVYEEKFLIKDTTYRFSYTLGKRDKPTIEKLV